MTVRLGLVGIACVLLAGCAGAQVVRQTDFERGTLFGLERVTHDDSATEDVAGVCADSIAYDTDKDGNWEIYLKSLTGRDVTRKTTSSATDVSPTVTSDCSRIAFVSTREGPASIYIIAGRQASAALKVGEGTSPDFDHAGKALYYQRFLPGEDSVSIWRFDLATNQHSQLVTGIHPAISPDGKQLAYAKFNDATGRTALWVLDLATQQELQVASDERRAVVLPHWSPDGRRILFTLNSGAVGDRNRAGDEAFENSDIAVVNKDGTGLTILTDNPVNDLGRAWDNGYIYFASHREKSIDVWRFKPQFVDDQAPQPAAPAPAATAAAPEIDTTLPPLAAPAPPAPVTPPPTAATP